MSDYAPDDSVITPETLAFLHSHNGERVRRQALALYEAHPGPSVADIERLRKGFPADSVHAALTLAKLQPKAREKFPNLANHFIYAVPEALEQATDFAVAQYKASRFARAGAAHILDLCCGIGGDTLALANIAPTTAVDLSETRLACLRYNMESAQTRYPLTLNQADVTTIPVTQYPLPNSLFHIDPARRSEGKRSPKFEDLIPGPEYLNRLLRQFPGGAIKLSPAVDFESLPPGHLEIISHDRSVVQAVLWTGTLGNLSPADTRTVSVFKSHRLAFTFNGTPMATRTVSLESFATLPKYMFELDPAFTRAKLGQAFADVAHIHLAALTEDAGYLAGPQPVDHPALTAFQMLQVLPYSESKLIKAIQDPSLPPADPGPVEVKTRGRLPGVDTDRLQKVLTKAAPRRRTIFIFRTSPSAATTAVIAERPPRNP